LVQAIISCPQPCHTQDFDLYRVGAIEFIHALHFCEGDKVATLKSMPGLIQAGDNPRAILVGRKVSLRGTLRVPRGDRENYCCPPPCQNPLGLISLPS